MSKKATLANDQLIKVVKTAIDRIDRMYRYKADKKIRSTPAAKESLDKIEGVRHSGYVGAQLEIVLNEFIDNEKGVDLLEREMGQLIQETKEKRMKGHDTLYNKWWGSDDRDSRVKFLVQLLEKLEGKSY